jgi:hypothetical protein
MNTKLALGLIPLLIAVAPAATPSTAQHVDAVFAEMSSLRDMKSGERYRLPAAGEIIQGRGDDFLRRRTAAEVRDSGLSCGCGDYAVVFIDLIQRRGFESLLVDSAQISSISIANNFAGHAVVAIRPRGEAAAPWWLVDSTARKIISREWSPEARSFAASGFVYWIGYCGPLEKYPVRSPDELKRFYRETLAQVPREFFNRTLFRFKFTIDESLADGRGGCLNPRVPKMGPLADELLQKYRVEPETEIAIRVVRGDDDASGVLRQQNGEWVARVGLRSACSPGFLTYCERVIRDSLARR